MTFGVGQRGAEHLRSKSGVHTFRLAPDQDLVVALADLSLALASASAYGHVVVVSVRMGQWMQHYLPHCVVCYLVAYFVSQVHEREGRVSVVEGQRRRGQSGRCRKVERVV